MKLKTSAVIILAFGVLPNFACGHQDKEALERYSIDQLSLYSVNNQPKAVTATVQDSDGYLHTVKVGDAVGNTRLVTLYCITKDRVYLEKLTQETAGTWFSDLFEWRPGQRPAQNSLPRGTSPKACITSAEDIPKSVIVH